MSDLRYEQRRDGGYDKCPTCGHEAGSELAAPNGYAAEWKLLATRLAEEAQTCLDNAHWEVSYGSGDMRETIKAIRLLKEVEANQPHSGEVRDGGQRK